MRKLKEEEATVSAAASEDKVSSSVATTADIQVEVNAVEQRLMEKMQEKTAKALETTSGALSRACEEMVDFQRESGEFAQDMFREFQEQASGKLTITDGVTEGQKSKSMSKQMLAECNTQFWNWFPLLCGSPGNNSPLDDVLAEEKIAEY